MTIKNKNKRDDLLGHVLIIDDEKNILKLFERDFYRTDIGLHTALNFEDAFEIVSKQEIDLVICDLKMKFDSGLDLLKKLKCEHAGIHRVLLSGVYAKPEIIKAITNGTASAFISKPWERDVLLNQITHILETRKGLKSNKILDLIQSIKELPTLPKIYVDFMEAYNKDVSIKEISEILHKDIAITTEVLRITNSAYYGSVEISDLPQAILHLGLKYVKDIVFTVTVTNQMNWTAKQRVELIKIIDHSVRVNKCLHYYFQEKYDEAMDKDYSSAGMIHDLGKIILLQYFPERFKGIQKYIQKHPGSDWYDAEIILGYEGCTHAEIGAFFLDYWNFPELNIEMSLHHHKPEDAPKYIKKFMFGLRYINTFVNTFYKNDDFGKLSEFRYDDLTESMRESLFFKCVED